MMSRDLDCLPLGCILVIKMDENVRKCLFVLRFYGSVNPMGSCLARSAYLTTLLADRFSPLKELTIIVHILLPETDNYPS